MPLTNTGSVAFAAMKSAADAARDAYMAGKDVLTAAQVLELVEAMEEARLNALFLHLQANAVVETVVAGSSATGGPVTGTGTGTIT